MSEPATTTALVATAPSSLPMPVFSGEQMVQGLAAYRDLQQRLDAAMPDQIIRQGERAFRRKGYWRAIRLAFKVKITLVEERREVIGTFDDGRDNFGWLVTYEASAKGSSVPGDGACFAVEKAEKFRCPHPHPSWKGKSEHYPHETCPDYDDGFRWRVQPAQATDHNCRSHAHTRAFNRAVSNLVAFGEVSAEEIEPPGTDHSLPDDDERPAMRRPAPPPRAMNPQVISEPQAKRLWAIAKSTGWQEHEVRSYLQRTIGTEHVHEITRDRYDAICRAIENGDAGSTRSAS